MCLYPNYAIKQCCRKKIEGEAWRSYWEEKATNK